jgi:hypothetical protein
VRLNDRSREAGPSTPFASLAQDCADVHSAETMVSVCRVGLKVMDGGGFAASLDEFSKAWAIDFPDVVSSKSKKVLTKM